MKTPIPHRLPLSVLLILIACSSFAQSGISIRYIKDFVSQAKPKIGIVYSYDSIHLEATLKELSAKGGLGAAMFTGLAVQTVASRKAFAQYEALTTPALSKIKNFENVAYVDSDDELVRMSLDAQVARANSLMKKEGVDLLVNVIFGGKFMNGTVQEGPNEKDVFFLHGEVKYRFYVNPVSGITRNYLQAPVFDMSYQYGEDASQKEWDSDKVQQYLAKKHLGEYAEMFTRLKYIFENENYFNSEPLGIVRSVEDDKRINIQTNVHVVGEGGFTRTLDAANKAAEGDYGIADAKAFWTGPSPTTFSEGLVVAEIRGDNKSTPYTVETGYRIPIAELIAREGDRNGAICRVRKLPNGIELKDLVGMTVVASTHANWYFLNPNIPSSIGSLELNKGKTQDESFLKQPPKVFKSAEISAVTNVVDGDGIAWPLEIYSDNKKVIPTTAIKNDPSGFSVDKVRSITETINSLSDQDFKVGVVYSPYMTKTEGKGILRYFSDSDIDKFVKVYEEILGTSSGASAKSKLTDLDLYEVSLHPLDGKFLDAGESMIKMLNEKYNTNIFELIDADQLPEGKAKLASKSKLLSKLSDIGEITGGTSLKIVSLSETQYKLLGNYKINVNEDKKWIESHINLYYTGSVGLTSVGAGFRTNNPESPFLMKESTLDVVYDKFMLNQKSLLDAMSESLWENKEFKGPSFKYDDNDILHPPTDIQANAKPNVVPKKEKSLLEKVRRYETEGHKIGIVLTPLAVVLEKEKPQTSMNNPALAADTVDCIFQPGGLPFPESYLYLSKKLEDVFNEQFETTIFQFVDAGKFPKKKSSGFMKLADEEPNARNTQFKTLISLTLTGQYLIKNVGSSSITVAKSSTADKGSKEGKYEMLLNIYGQLGATEFNDENGKDKKVFGNLTAFASDRFRVNDCPSSIDDFVTSVGSLEDFFRDFETMFDQNIDKVISKEKK